MKTLIFKRYGVVKIYMLFKCTTKDNCKKDIDFILPLYFSIDHIKKIELAWKKI